MSGQEIAARYDLVLLDLDGVVYRADQVVPAAPGTISKVRELGVPLQFLTNNSSRTPEQVVAKLAGLGVEARPDEVLTSAQATAAMLRRERASEDPPGSVPKTAFVIGERGIRDALASSGIRLLDGEATRADLVVVGWDRSVDYAKLRTAALLVQRGARLIATNSDASFPAPDGMWPGAGAILSAVTTTTGASPTVVGKPARPMFEAAAERTGATRPLMVGDRIDTDIAGAAAMGWDSLLVRTGASRPADLLLTSTLPTYLGADLSLLLQAVPPASFQPAEQRDLAPCARLLETAGLSAAGLEDRLASTLVLRSSDPSRAGDPGVLATACLEASESDAILRSVAVDPEQRARGLGILAVAAATRQARRQGRLRVFLFTETAEPFFRSLGFRTVARADLPNHIAGSTQAKEECAANAAAMVLDLVATPGRRGAGRASGENDPQ